MIDMEDPQKELIILQELLDDLKVKCTNLNTCEKVLFDRHCFPSHRAPISRLEGHLILVDFPCFGFVLRSETVDYFLILSNPVNIITSYLKANKCKVSISNSFLAVEYYPEINQRFFPCPVPLYFLEVQEDVMILEKTHIEIPTSDKLKSTHWSQTFLILHSTAPLVIQGVAVCLVFVKFLLPGGSSQNIWLVLRGSMVSWSVGLFTGYKYELLIPSSIPSNIFAEHKQHLKALLPLEMQESFSSIFHHPRLFSTMDACYLPANTKLKLLHPSLSSSPVRALGVKEASSENVDLFSIFGQVTSVNHAIRKPSSFCIMCKKKAQKSLTARALNCDTISHSTKNSLKINHNIPTSGIVFPPSQTITVKNLQKSFGTLGCLVKEISMKDTDEDCETVLYVRDNYFRSGLESPKYSNGFFYAGGILPGTIVCFENVIQKATAEGRLYYVTSPLTKITLLCKPSDTNEPPGFDPPSSLSDWTMGRVFWFHSALDDLSSVKIAALCEGCGCFLVEGKICPSKCKDKKAKIDATAVLTINHHLLPSYSLILKGEHVRTYLCADDTLWKWFSIAAMRSPLAYAKDVVHSVHENEFSALFNHYCDIVRPQVRFHVCVKIMRPKEDGRNAVFCLDLSRVDVKRSLTHALGGNIVDLI